MPATRKPRRPRPITAPPDPILLDGVGRDVLEAQATVLAQSVVQQPGMSAERLAAERPGGANNSDSSAMGWLRYLIQLSRWHATGPGQPNAETLRWSPADADDLRAALAEEPVFVPCSDGTTRGVYPKGDYAIHRVSLIDAALQYVMPRRIALEGAETSPEMLDGVRAALELQSQLEREFLWIATHPSPDVPWDDDGQFEHAPPSWTRAMGGYDLAFVRAAYIEVNSSRLAVLAEHTHAVAGASGETMTQEQFTGVMAGELGVSSREIMRKWSRGMLTAIAFTKWDANRAAKAASEAAAA